MPNEGKHSPGEHGGAADSSQYAERAETYLRLLAESALRAGGDEETDRVHRAANTLVEAGVLTDTQVAWILLDLNTALRARGRRDPVWTGSRLRHFTGFMPNRDPGSLEDWRVLRAPGAAPGGQLMALVITSDRVLAPATLRLPPSAGIPDLELPPWADLSATDDVGTAYVLTFANGTWTGSTWTGTILVHPAPPPAARTLKILSPNGPLCLVPLSPGKHAPGEAADSPGSPGERLLTRHAEALLATLPVGGAVVFGPGNPRFPELADILEAAGTLSPLSPVTRQIAALYQLLDLPAEGSLSDVPARWLAVVTHYGRRRHLPPVSGTASIGGALPVLDGARFAVAGLRSGEPGSFLYVVARGLRPPVTIAKGHGMIRHAGFSWWLRDDTGGWHLATIDDANPAGGDVVLRLALLPPLAHATTTLTAHVAGLSQEVTTTFQVCW